MRDWLLKKICQLEQWLEREDHGWASLPIRLCGYGLLLAALMFSNLLAVLLWPAAILKLLRWKPHLRSNDGCKPIEASSIEFERFMATSKWVLLDFWAPWCGPCLLMKPAIRELAEAAPKGLAVITVDTVVQSGLATEFRIGGLPTLVLMRQGREVGRHVGALDLTELHDFVDSTIRQAETCDVTQTEAI